MIPCATGDAETERQGDWRDSIRGGRDLRPSDPALTVDHPLIPIDVATEINALNFLPCDFRLLIFGCAELLPRALCLPTVVNGL